MLEYRHPTVFAPGLEGRISALVHQLVRTVDEQGQQQQGDGGSSAQRQQAAL